MITISRRGTLAVWELPESSQMKEDSAPLPDRRPVAVLIKLAQVLACERIDEQQRWQMLESRALAAYWQGLLSEG